MDAMQVTETLVEGLKHEFQISVPASDLDAKADVKLVELKDKVKLNGFRPGKVPVSHLKKVYGRSVMAETIDQTIRDTNTQIFTDRSFRLSTHPTLTSPPQEAVCAEPPPAHDALTRSGGRLLGRRNLLRNSIHKERPFLGVLDTVWRSEGLYRGHGRAPREGLGGCHVIRFWVEVRVSRRCGVAATEALRYDHAAYHALHLPRRGRR